MPPVVIQASGDDLDIESIATAIRARIAPRLAAGVPVAAAEVVALEAERVRSLEKWNLPAATWAAMFPPNLTPWNLDDDFPIRSHRARLGAVLVGLKRALRAVLRVAARPLVAQQSEINRVLALMTMTLAGELARERLHVAAVERRVARMGGILRELRGEAEPLVVITGDGAAASGGTGLSPDPRG